MNIEDMLLIKIKELTKSLDEFNAELKDRLDTFIPNSQDEQKANEKKKFYKEIKQLQFKITSTKSLLDTTISQLAFISSLEAKDKLAEEEKMKLQELSNQINYNNEIPFHKKDYSQEEADVIREAFESPLYNTATDSNNDLDEPMKR